MSTSHLAVAILAFYTGLVSCHLPPSVGTSSGILIGTESHDAFQYLGVPYAEPPVGELRFQDPRPYRGSSHPLLVQSHGSACMQHTKLSFYGEALPNQSEDCLTLNVYVPKRCAGERELAVMVWIHGGAYLVGGSEQFPGHFLAVKEGVIVVTINYRLGIWGFLTSGDSRIPGNMGLKDQLMALQWVQHNIQQFGGSPNKVTVFGQSAGGMSITLHMINPQAKGLFQRAITMSGAVTNQILHERSSRRWGPMLQGLGSGLGCPDGENILECLQEVDNDVLAHLDNMFYEPIVDGPGGSVPRQPSEALQHPGRDIDFMSGVMGDEGLVIFSMGLPGISPSMALSSGVQYGSASFLVDMILMKMYPLRDSMGSQFSPDQVEIIKNFYFQNRADGFDNLRSLMDFLGDVFFVAQTLKGVELMSDSPGKSHSYLYYFTHRDVSYPNLPFPMGPSHAGELRYIFEPCSSMDENLCSSFMHALATFAKNGEPFYLDANGHELKWMPYRKDTQYYLEITRDMDADSMKQKLRPRADSFWNSIIPSLLSCDQ